MFINVRRASREDNVSDLILYAAQDVFEAYGLDNIREVCDFLFQSENNKFSYQNTYIYESQDEIVGICIVYDQKMESKYAKSQEYLLMQKYGILVNVVDNEGVLGTCYIDTLAVSKNARRQGVGKYILNNISHLYPKLSLLCSVKNEAAFSLYSSSGFETLELQEVFGSTYYVMKKDCGGNNGFN